jgi:hypothetical protein
VFFMPSRRAYSFMIWMKPASVPPNFSASAMVASLPDCTIMPWMSTSTGTREFTSRKVVEPPDAEPPVRQAYSLTNTSSVSVRRFSRSASKAM